MDDYDSKTIFCSILCMKIYCTLFYLFFSDGGSLVNIHDTTTNRKMGRLAAEKHADAFWIGKWLSVVPGKYVRVALPCIHASESTADHSILKYSGCDVHI